MRSHESSQAIVWPEPLLFRQYVHRPHCTDISFVKAQAIEAFKLQLQLRQHPATSEVAKHVIHGPHFNLRHDHQLNLSPAKKQSLVILNFLLSMSEKTTPQGPFHPAGSYLPPSLTAVCVCSPVILTAATTNQTHRQQRAARPRRRGPCPPPTRGSPASTGARAGARRTRSTPCR